MLAVATDGALQTEPTLQSLRGRGEHKRERAHNNSRKANNRIKWSAAGKLPIIVPNGRCRHIHASRPARQPSSYGGQRHRFCKTIESAFFPLWRFKMRRLKHDNERISQGITACGVCKAGTERCHYFPAGGRHGECLRCDRMTHKMQSKEQRSCFH